MKPETERRYVLWATSLGAFLTPFMGSAVNVALPAIGERFGMDAVGLGWVATAYILAAAVGMLPLGRVADIYGRRVVFGWGVAVFVVGALAAALSVSGPMLIVARVIQGIGGAMTFGTGTALLTASYPPGSRGHALGWNVATVYVGLSVGPVLGGLLTRYLGWRSVFFAVVPLGLVAFVMAMWLLRDDRPVGPAPQFDTVGSAVYGVSLLALMYGLSLLPRVAGAGLVLVGLAGLAAFAAVERRVASPVFNLRLFRGNAVFTLSSVAALVNYSATSAVGFLVSIYLQSVRSLGPGQAGLVLIAAPVLQAAISPLAGRLSDRTEPRVVASVGMGLTAAGLGLLVLLGARTPLGFVVAGLALLGVGFGLFSSPNTNAIMSSVASDCYGVASSTVATVRLVGQMLSMGVVMLLFSVKLGGVEVGAATPSLLVSTMRPAFAIFALLCTGGIFASLGRGRLRPSPTRPTC